MYNSGCLFWLHYSSFQELVGGTYADRNVQELECIFNHFMKYLRSQMFWQVYLFMKLLFLAGCLKMEKHVLILMSVWRHLVCVHSTVQTHQAHTIASVMNSIMSGQLMNTHVRDETRLDPGLSLPTSTMFETCL